jgi:hypothetical protein
MKNNLNYNQKLQNFIFPFWIEYLLIFVICVFFLGPKIFLIHPNHINPDPYGYLAIANYYLYTSSPHLKDAFTVGPVIPGLFFIIKLFFNSFLEYNISDVKILKFFVFTNYLFIFFLAYRFQKSELNNLKSFLFICLFFGFMKIDSDTLSFNAELFGVFLILLIMNIGLVNFKIYLKAFLISLISVIALYTKVQLIPLIILSVLSETKSRCERIWAITFFNFNIDAP